MAVSDAATGLPSAPEGPRAVADDVPHDDHDEAGRAAAPLLAVRDLAKRYRDHVAVRELSFDVHAGEVFGLLGKNGAGKSTTLGMLAGHVIPTRGHITYRGGDIVRQRARYRAETGLVSQTATLDRRLTVERLLTYHGRYFGLSRRQAGAAATEALRLVGLQDRAGRPAAVLSGGEAARLMIARALLHRPALVFLDEPATGLDTQSREALWRLLRTLNEQGVAMILTTHHLDEAAALCHRVAIMDRGRLLALDTPQRLVEAHAGRGVLEAEVADVSDAAWSALREAFPDAVLSADRTWAVLPTDAPRAALAMLTGLADRHGVTVLRIVTRQPSLESAYVALTSGREAD